MFFVYTLINQRNTRGNRLLLKRQRDFIVTWFAWCFFSGHNLNLLRINSGFICIIQILNNIAYDLMKQVSKACFYLFLLNCYSCFVCDIVYVSCEIKNALCVRHKAVHQRHRNDVLDRIAHASKQLETLNETLYGRYQTKENIGSRPPRHMRQIFYLLFISLLFFISGYYFFYDRILWADQYRAFRILRIFTSSYVGLDVKIRVYSQFICVCCWFGSVETWIRRSEKTGWSGLLLELQLLSDSSPSLYTERWRAEKPREWCYRLGQLRNCLTWQMEQPCCGTHMMYRVGFYSRPTRVTVSER